MSLKLLVNDKGLYTDFLEELQVRIAIEQSKLEQMTATEDMFRCQGEIKALRKLMQLREKING